MGPIRKVYTCGDRFVITHHTIIIVIIIIIIEIIVTISECYPPTHVSVMAKTTPI